MHGLYILWWVQAQHVPAAAVATALAAGDLALTLFEIPTGWLADRYGHRASLIAGSILQTLGMFACWRAASGARILMAALLVALGDAFRSGADQALLYRTCQALAWHEGHKGYKGYKGPEEAARAFQQLEARSRAIQLVALVLFTLAGGAIVSAWGFTTGWLAEIVLSVAGLAIAVAMVEPSDSSDTDQPRKHENTKPYVLVFRDFVFSWPFDERWMAPLILPAALLAGASSCGLFFAQTMGSMEASTSTALVAAVTLVEAAGSLAAAHLSASLPAARVQLMLGGAGAATIAVVAVWPTALLGVVVVLSLLAGIAQPLRAAAIQRAAAEHTRARLASIASACDKALTAAGLVGAGWLRRG